jgi:hypothetical protein
MKIKKSKLKQLINEEWNRMNEMYYGQTPHNIDHQPQENQKCKEKLGHILQISSNLQDKIVDDGDLDDKVTDVLDEILSTLRKIEIKLGDDIQGGEI